MLNMMTMILHMVFRNFL